MQIFRLLLFVCLGIMASSVLTSSLIPILKHKQFQQFIREEGPKSHYSKEGTPTMGGIAMIIALILVTLIGAKLNHETIVLIVVTLLFALIGFMDDYIKVTEKHNLGLRAWQKLLLQVIFSAGLAVYMAKYSGYGTGIWIPIADKYVDFGFWFIPFVIFVMVAMTNAVNLTDGLDGLCSGVTAQVAFFLAVTGMVFGHNQPMMFSCALCGACIGFLIFNKYPAQLFMGDTGSMALGAALSAAAILMKMELMLPIVGFIYVWEAASVIIQVVSFKTTGKRVFRMAPIHHHFELGGMKETRVVLMFWLITLLCSVVGYVLILI